MTEPLTPALVGGNRGQTARGPGGPRPHRWLRPPGTTGGVRVRARFGDLTAREITVLTPLVALVILLGVYPQPVLNVINPTAERTVVDVGFTDPPPAVDAGEEGQ